MTPSPGVDLYDTTLRDGTQREGLSLSLHDKLRVAERLGRFGVRFVEGGWPGSNPKDAAFFEAARGRRFGTAELAAFGSTCRSGVQPQDDLQVRALLEAETRVVTIFGKSWTLHVDRVLRTRREENLRMIEATVGFLRGRGRRVVYDAEHFFDGYAENPEYALATLDAAKRGGAEVLVLCDTNGGSLPWSVASTVREVARRLDHPLGIHAHDDGGCAVANSLAAVHASAAHVQGTINGYGERCGNADLVACAADLQLKMGRRCVAPEKLEELTALSRFVAEVANLPPNPHQPFAGRSAFAHKGGVHVSAMRRDGQSYQHVDPALVGNECRVVVSELSGRSNVLSKAEELGLRADGREASVLREIKEREAVGYAYEAAEASVALLIARRDEDYVPPFVVVDHQVAVGKRRKAQATVKVAVGDETRLAAGEGNGPVSALDAALRMALEPMVPALREIRLTDYKVRILDGHRATDAITRVLIECARDGSRWSTVGASPDILEASLQALVDAYEWGLRDQDAAAEEEEAKAT